MGGEAHSKLPAYRYACPMTRMPPEARGTREFSSPDVRVRSDQQPPFHARERLLLPRERRRRAAISRLTRIIVPLVLLIGIGVGVYFGVYYLLRDGGGEAAPAATPAAAPAEPAADTTAEPAASTTAEPTAEPAPAEQSAATPATQTPPEQSAAAEPQAAPEPTIHPARVEPTVDAESVTPAAVGGAPLVGERMTAEALPAGIPRELADDSPYDPADATAAFSNLWPVGTTLRLTRLPGAPLLSEDQAAQVIGAAALVVVRGSENSNTDIQLSAAAFEQVGFYERERIIAVRVEVVGAPP